MVLVVCVDGNGELIGGIFINRRKSVGSKVKLARKNKYGETRTSGKNKRTRIFVSPDDSESPEARHKHAHIYTYIARIRS